MGLTPDEEFVILRLNAFGSHHDVGAGGFTPEISRRLIERLAEYATVFVSDEGGALDLSSLPARRFDLHPGRLHDALATASLLVTDTQTMATEAALLGTPTVRSNSFVGEDDMGNFLELETAGLIRNVPDATDVPGEAVELLTEDGTRRKWRRRCDRYMDGMADVSKVLTRVAESPDEIAAVPQLSPAR
jgi:predicted glycosyltransferase